MNWQEEYDRWQKADLVPYLKNELNQLAGNDKALEDHFYKNLEFGTGGMRGELGPGTNRLNLYTIRKAAEGLARYIDAKGEAAKSRGVVIAHDPRRHSDEFTLEAARVIGKHGIKVYVFDSLRPTPVLSFAVRHLEAFAGIVITASHNPPQYNGFKVYNEAGGQLPPEAADDLIAYVNDVEDELAIEAADAEELKNDGYLEILDDRVDQAYQEELTGIQVNRDVLDQEAPKLNIVFTPLHGTALVPVTEAFKRWGFSQVTVVKEQAAPDSEFSTVDKPNPEEHEAFELAIQYGEEIGADLLLGTDPDADRVGVAVKNNGGEYQVLTGNQTGAILIHYLLSQKQEKGELPDNGIVMKTIVTSELGRAVAESFGVKTEDTLTGFKFIGEKIAEFEETQNQQFLFGYEESYGYLIGDFVRDKDAVQACLLAAEAAAFYKSQGKTLYDALQEIYETYGHYREGLESLTLKGIDGSAQIEKIIGDFRQHPPEELAGLSVTAVEDYQSSRKSFMENGMTEEIILPVSNVLKYHLADGSWCCLRPSGTEPKIKFYIGVNDDSATAADQKLSDLRHALMDRVNKILG